MSNDQLPFGDLGTSSKLETAPSRWDSLIVPKGSGPDKASPAPEKETAEPKKTTDLNSTVPAESSTGAQPVEVQPASQEKSEEVVYSVSDINRLIKGKIESHFKTVWIQAEISNFKAHSSGHYYFSLKDESSQISAVMFKGLNSKLKFRPESGMEVVVQGKVTVYEPRGNYQVFCQQMEPVGAGALQKAFEQLKLKLQKEGLFSQETKKPLPLFPQSIGVVTSPTGAAIQDILNVLGRRCRSAQVTVIPARVQGDTSAQEVARAIEQANQVGGFDVLIVGRGGGSLEDLWCFNEEVVARAIYASEIPIISAVGHEVDFSISDFVADLRAPTPSAAAEVVAKSGDELLDKIKNFQGRLLRAQKQKIRALNEQAGFLAKRLVDPKRRLEDLSIQCDDLLQRLQNSMVRNIKQFQMSLDLLFEKIKDPREGLKLRGQKIEHLNQRLNGLMQQSVQTKKQNLKRSMGLLNSLSPLAVVERGFSITYKDKEIIREAQQVEPGDQLDLQLSKGALRVSVEKKEEQWTLKKRSTD